MHPAIEAYQLVLEQAGAWPRDTVTQRTVYEVETGTGAWGREVPQDFMEVPQDFMAGLTPAAPPADSDGDGMPDDWETDRGLNPAADDHSGDDDSDGHTNIEEYLHYRSNLVIFANSGKLLGDVNRDFDVNLQDAVAALQIMAGASPNTVINLNCDVNQDGVIGLAEVIYALQFAASLRKEREMLSAISPH